MKRVIRFQRTRYYFFGLSAAIFIAGALFFVFGHGFNLGVDFKAGLELQFQIAPASFALEYTGPGTAQVSVPVGEQAFTAPGDFLVEITNSSTGLKTTHPFRFADYKTIKDLTDDIVAKVPGVTATPKGDMNLPPTEIVPPVDLADITGKLHTFNVQPSSSTPVTIGDIREALASLGTISLQEAGVRGGQEFMARVEAPATEDKNFQTATTDKVKELLGEKFGADQIVMTQTNYVGPRVSQALSRQSIWLVVMALLGILVYMFFRFKPIYAIAAVLALFHDALLMLAYNSIAHLEVDAATIAAILTVLGYSINDTIVIFDRVRENHGLMRGQGLETILDTSVSQNLARTFITSGATLLTIVALFLLTKGDIKIFATNMLVGVVEGVYSTIFIASPIVLEWENYKDRRKKRLEAEKFGIKPEKPKVEEEPELEEEEEETAAPLNAEELSLKTEAEVKAEAAAEAAAAEGAPSDGQGQPEPAAGQTAEQKNKILSYPGGQGQAYRYHHKRHKGRHHH